MSTDDIYARRLLRETSARQQAEALLEQKSLELFNQAQQREQAVTALRESEERFRLIVELSPDAILIEVDSQIVFVNSAARTLFAETSANLLIGKSLAQLINPVGPRASGYGPHDVSGQEKEALAIRLDGSIFEASVQRAALTFNHQNALQMVVRDISLRKQMEQQLAHQANHDSLTGVANRPHFFAQLSEALNDAKRHGLPVWVGFLDLDRFKLINDKYGHHIGDQLLIATTARLKAVLRKNDVLGRFGGDEFILMLRGGPDGTPEKKTLACLMAAVSEPLIIEAHHLQLTCSLGVATYPHDGQDAETLIEYADTAMYRAKESGRNLCQFFTREMGQKHMERSFIESALYTVLERNELFLHYQPQLNPRTGRIVGVEALLRWQHPQLGLLAPDRFISIAEDNGMIGKIGAWVMQQACLQCAAWVDAGLGPLRISVNLSVRQLIALELIAIINEALARSGLKPEVLELELTETMMMVDVDRTQQLLRELRAIGVKIAVDDFGVGHSSFAYLKRLPLDGIKIDKTFVQGLEDDEDSQAIVSTLIQLAHNLKLRVVAEGVETAFQLDFLTQHHCDEIQGHLFSRARPAAEVEALLRAQQQPMTSNPLTL